MNMKKTKMLLLVGVAALSLTGAIALSGTAFTSPFQAYGVLEKVEDNEYVYAAFGYNKVAADSFANGKTLLKTADGKNNGFSFSVDGKSEHRWAVSYQNTESAGSEDAYYSWQGRYLFGASSEDSDPVKTLDDVNGNLLTMSTEDSVWGGVASYAQSHNSGDDASEACVGLMMQYDIASLEDLHVYWAEQEGSFFGYVLYSTDQGTTWLDATDADNRIFSGAVAKTSTGLTFGGGGEVITRAGSIESAGGTAAGLALNAGAKAAKNVRLCFVVRNVRSDLGQPIHLAAITVNQSKALDAYLYNDAYTANGKDLTLGTAHKNNTGSDLGYLTADQEMSLLSYGITPSEGAQAKLDYIQTYCVQ